VLVRSDWSATGSAKLDHSIILQSENFKLWALAGKR
jgi:hypothetical protein